ncbi:hypothetical protein POSPLADRAFT_1131222 [Postia placenta MAD-698-R-SB12]|uniref:Uncharacterized protein n=1 Tax=Postia placenta MAD-698-R-SB12 TaxID=670580 RepID=A0A1X6NBV2_9APHY|nr:hypothetical protein POSPLADRAFT_1131222 [Postia placenta MAD-698-R-SB12]OSX66129.1 hypothetical protein POSPLADRAFT_1131222 [Postia placenta MAD-698-R-SB12]
MSINVACTAQLVPVIAALIESAIQSTPIHEDLDQGSMEDKDLSKDVREAVARENNRWKDFTASGMKGKGNLKEERALHKQTLQDLEHAHIVATSAWVPRYYPLGQDLEGRTYYALTPSEAEREAASKLIAGKDGRVKLHRKRGALTEEERREMQRWSWFIAVWGQLPEGAKVAKTDDEDDDGVDEGGESWWGFWDPAEVRKVAEWIAVKCELGEGKPRSQAALNTDKGKQVDRSSTYDTLASSLAGSREPSPLSDLSSDEEENDDENNDEEEDLYAGMRVDSQDHPVPTRRELRGLVKRLKEYADLLEWRIRRVGGEGSGEKNQDVLEPIPPKRFYK